MLAPSRRAAADERWQGPTQRGQPGSPSSWRRWPRASPQPPVKVRASTVRVCEVGGSGALCGGGSQLAWDRRWSEGFLTELPSGAAPPGLRLPEFPPRHRLDPGQPSVPSCPCSRRQDQSGGRACKQDTRHLLGCHAIVVCGTAAFCWASPGTRKTYLLGGKSASGASLGPVPCLPGVPESSFQPPR